MTKKLMILGMALMLCGCSANKDAASTTTSTVANEVVTSGETTQAITETTKEQEKTVTSLKVKNPNGIEATSKGWYADYLADNLGISISDVSAINSYEEADIVCVICTPEEGINTEVEKISTDDLIELSDELLSNYGSNIKEYFSNKLYTQDGVVKGVYAGLNYGEETQNNIYLWAITKSCKDVNAAMTYINFLADPDTMIMTRCGVKDVNWTEKDGIYSVITAAEVGGGPAFGTNMWMGASVNPKDKNGKTFNDIFADMK